MAEYEYRRCTVCGQEFLIDLDRDLNPDRTLCSECEAGAEDQRIEFPSFPISYMPLSIKPEPPRQSTRTAPGDPLYELLRKTRLLGLARSANYRAANGPNEGNVLAEELLAKFREQKGCCAYCNEPLAHGWELDHVIPLSRGGTNTVDNVVFACPSCNRHKMTRTPEEWRADEQRRSKS